MEGIAGCVTLSEASFLCCKVLQDGHFILKSLTLPDFNVKTPRKTSSENTNSDGDFEISLVKTDMLILFSAIFTQHICTNQMIVLQILSGSKKQ